MIIYILVYLLHIRCSEEQFKEKDFDPKHLSCKMPKLMHSIPNNDSKIQKRSESSSSEDNFILKHKIRVPKNVIPSIVEFYNGSRGSSALENPPHDIQKEPNLSLEEPLDLSMKSRRVKTPENFDNSPNKETNLFKSPLFSSSWIQKNQVDENNSTVLSRFTPLEGVNIESKVDQPKNCACKRSSNFTNQQSKNLQLLIQTNEKVKANIPYYALLSSDVPSTRDLILNSCNTSKIKFTSNMNLEHSKIFDFLGQLKDPILIQSLVPSQSIMTGRGRNDIITFLNRFTLTLPLKINYSEVIHKLEMLYMVSIVNLVCVCNGVNREKCSYFKDVNETRNFYNLIFNFLILEKLDLRNKKNSFAEISNQALPHFMNYISEYNEYIKQYFSQSDNIFNDKTKKYYLPIITRLRQLCIFSFSTESINFFKASFSSKLNLESITIFVKLYQKIIETEEFRIINLMIPELEEVLGYLLSCNLTFRNLRTVHFIISFIFCKFLFLEKNIANEIKENMSNHTETYLDSPLLKSFVTSVQTLLLTVFTARIGGFRKVQTFLVLLSKNFLSYISVRNVYRKDFKSHFFINFIEDQNFSLENLEDIVEFYQGSMSKWFLQLNASSFPDFENGKDFKHNLISILKPEYEQGIEFIFVKVKEKVSKVKEYFLRTK
ncbi:hypothetical protein TUBRATIS_009130 [Tubulinosema ratisbonensis]|uniref:Uncharacterized protein n=1 Tax=Tubulinosema ratisbonensis TaxID=291195 RepID=A0A437AN25_9MICR|nr:hypothetical protein TUBRATIS_009130 [Tubulinosema ratisbonensis]